MAYDGNSDPLGVAGVCRVLEVGRQAQILRSLATAMNIPLPRFDLVGPGPYTISVRLNQRQWIDEYICQSPQRWQQN